MDTLKKIAKVTWEVIKRLPKWLIRTKLGWQIIAWMVYGLLKAVGLEIPYETVAEFVTTLLQNLGTDWALDAGTIADTLLVGLSATTTAVLGHEAKKKYDAKKSPTA